MYENDLSIQVKIFKNSFQQLQITNYLIQMRLEDRMYQQDKVRELNKYEDILDVFIHIVMIRLPTAFTLINMILIIWLVQTIFSSLNADLIPRSLLFYAPLMAAHPIVDISFAEGSCSDGYEQVILKTFPTLTAESIRRANLTKWRQQKHICVKRVDKEINLTNNCSNSETYCSGLCVNERSQCPITGIKKVNSIELVLPDEQVFYNSSDHLYKYVISRQSKNTYIIGISAQFQYQCANQYKYYETFPDFNAYWKTVKECGKQGSLSSQSFHPFDSYPTVEFLFANGLWSESMNNSETVHSITTLGYISNIQYKNKQTMCTDVESKAKILSNKILQKPLQPLFSKSLLIISFVFFTVCWAWLLVLYCCQAETVFKNTFVILLAIIQFITIAFIYYENLQQFQLQSLVELVSNCVDQNMPAFENWSFGLSNRSPLISIMFACCTFVLLESVSYFFHYFIYEVYSFQRIDSMFGSISYSSYIHEQDLN